MAKTFAQKMEEAAGISSPTPKMPYGKEESIPGKGGVARPWTGPRPWKNVPLIPRAKGGSVSPPRSKVMKTKGMPLAGFMPSPKKSKKGKKRVVM